MSIPIRHRHYMLNELMRLVVPRHEILPRRRQQMHDFTLAGDIAADADTDFKRRPLIGFAGQSLHHRHYFSAIDDDTSHRPLDETP